MKKLLPLLILVLMANAAKAQYVTIPGYDFRSWLMFTYPSCFNVAQQMDTTCSAILNVTQLTLNNVDSADGIQYFKGLTKLTIMGSSMGGINALPPNLNYLELNSCFLLKNITRFPPGLNYLSVTYCPVLYSLPAVPNGVQYFYCNNNHLTSLPNVPDMVSVFNCSYNYLTSIPSLNTANYLSDLNWSFNQLTSIPVIPGQPSSLSVGNNKLSSLPPLPSGINSLDISYNLFTAMPQLPQYLGYLICGANQLASIPPLPSFLLGLTCPYNNLTSLPALPSSLQYLVCAYNPLITSLPPLPSSLSYLNIVDNNIDCLPVLPVSMTTLIVDTGRIKCVPNGGSNLKVYADTAIASHLLSNIPFCNATNNVHGCQAFPQMEGKVFYDLNSNGVKDAAEHYRRLSRVNLSNGAFTFTNDSGFYQLSADTLGTMTLTPVAPALFQALPINKTFSFTTNDTLVTQNFALQPTAIKDSVKVMLFATSAARPGFSIPFQVGYENVGSTNLGVLSITLHYNASRLTYTSSSNPSVIHSGNTLTVQIPSLTVGGFGSFVVWFTINPSVPLGTIITTDAAISSGSASSVDTSYLLTVGSFDPNDKQATSALTPAQLASGAYIDYVIRFQNTGTDTAFNVVIADTLSSQLQANTFELTGSSHLCKATVKDRVAMFEMRNILLPDSNVNEPASHGFVRFRIKPAGTVTLGNSVSNKAAIYFDYNSPVITNLATTQIVLQVVPLTLLNFTAKKDGKTNRLQWSTANAVNVDRFEVERSGGGREYSRMQNVKCKMQNENSYELIDYSPLPTHNYYRLKIVDKDGSFTYSPVRLINNGSSFYVSIYPNPAKAQLQVEMVSDKKSALQVQILAPDGRVLLSQQWNVSEGTTLQTLNVAALKSGSYFLKLMSESKEQSVVKFGKL